MNETVTFEEVINSEEFTQMCESEWCRKDAGKLAHEAHWIVSFSCTCVIYWCADRMERYITEDLPRHGTVRCDYPHRVLGVKLTHSIPLRAI